MQKDYWKQKILSSSKIFLTILLLIPLLFCIGLYVKKYNNTIENIFIQCEDGHPDYIRVYYDNGTGFSDLQSRYYFFSSSGKTVITARHIKNSKVVRIELHSKSKKDDLEYRIKIYYKGRQCNPHFLENAVFYNAERTFLDDHTIVLTYEPQEEPNNFKNIVIDYKIDSSSMKDYILSNKISWYQYNYIIASYKKYFLLLGITFILFLLCLFPKHLVYQKSIYIYACILIFITIIRIFDDNFWCDEIFSIQLSKMNISQMIHTTANDVHPPLYYLILMAMARCFGFHGWVYHLTSVIPYLFIVIFTLTIILRRYGKAVSFLFLTFISISQTAVYFNVEVRMYSLALALVLFSYYSLLLILEKKRQGYILFIVFSLGAAYSHYYELFLVSFFYIALLIQILRKKEKLWRLILVYMTTIIGYLPWLLIIITPIQRRTKSFWMKSYPGIIECLKYYYESNKIWYSYGMILITFISLILIICKDMEIFTAIKEKKSIFKNLKPLSIETLWSIWGIVASIGIVLIGQAISYFIRPALTFRYIYPVVAVTWLVLCVNINKIKFRKIFISIIFIVSLVVYIPLYQDTYTREKINNKRCEKTATQMQSYIASNDILLTNIKHFYYNVISYYISNAKNIEYIITIQDIDINSINKKFNEKQKYWLVLQNSLTKDEIDWLHSMGYNIKEIIINGHLGRQYNFTLYALIKK